jgi:hypothetical protein
MEKEVSQAVTVAAVKRGAMAESHGGPAGGLAEARRRRVKFNARQSMTTAILGEGKSPGLLLRTLAAMGKAVDRDPEGLDVAMHLDIADRCIRALPWILEKEGDAEGAATLAKALAGHTGPVQIVFGQHFHARSTPDQGQAGQALPSLADAGSKPDQPA